MKRKLFIFTTTLALLAGGACTRKPTENTELPNSETLRVRVSGEPPSLDWQQADDIPSVFILENIMEGLLRYDFSSPGRPSTIPGLATEWKVSRDAKTYVFKLRKDAKWSDGVPFVAQHALDAWKRTLTKETGAPYSRFLFHVKNAKCFFDGNCPFEKVGFKALGDHEIKIDLEYHVSFFPYLLAHFSSHPIRVDLIEKSPSAWTDPGRLVTLGPFTLKAWEHDKLIVLERNPHYYSQNPAGARYVLIYMVEEWVTAFNLYKAGTIDYADGIPAVEVRQLESHPDFKRIPRMASSYFGFNTAKAPTNNLRLRQAIAHAIDRTEILSLIQGGRALLNSIVPAGLTPPRESALEFSPEKARALLARSGLKAPLQLTYRFASGEDNRRIAENVQAQLKRNLGIEVTLLGQEFKTYVKNQRTDPTHIFPMGWAADYPDASVFFGLFMSDSLNNTARFKNAEYDFHVRKGHAAATSEDRLREYSQAQRILVDENVAVFPLYTNVVQYLVNPRVEGLVVNPRGLIDLRAISIRVK